MPFYAGAIRQRRRGLLYIYGLTMYEFKTEPPTLSADEKLNLLVEFGARISSELRLDKLLDIIAQQITRMLNVGRCTIFLKDGERKELWSKIAQGR